MVEEKVELRYWLSMLFELALAARPGREISREIHPVMSLSAKPVATEHGGHSPVRPDIPPPDLP